MSHQASAPRRRDTVRRWSRTARRRDPSAIGATAAQLLFAGIPSDTSPPRDVVLLTRLVALGSGEITLRT